MKLSTGRKLTALAALVVASGKPAPADDSTIYADDLGADLALLTALGFDPATHVLRPRMGKTEVGIEVVREDGTRADFFTHKALKLKKRDPAFMRRWAEAKGLDG